MLSALAARSSQQSNFCLDALNRANETTRRRWALVILGIIALIRLTTGDQIRSVSPPSTPDQVLANRFAHGEISETEYHDRLAILRDHAGH